MPILDIEGLKTDVKQINFQAKSYLNNFANIESKRYTITPDYLSRVVIPITNDLRHIFVVLNKNADDVKSIHQLVDTLDTKDIDRFNSVMNQVKDTSDAMLGLLDNYFATGSKVATDLQLHAMSLNEQLGKLVSLLKGKDMGIAIEENQELDTVKADDIDMGQLFLAYDEKSDDIKLGICRLMTLTLRGKSISSHEDGSDPISAKDTIYLDPKKYVPDEVVNMIEYLYDYEVNSSDDGVSALAQDTSNEILDFAVKVLNKDDIMKAIEYKRKYSKV